MVGWIVCGMKEVKDGPFSDSPWASFPNLRHRSSVAFLGDTFHHTHAPMPPLESFKPLKSMVFAGIYPLEPGGFLKLEEAVRRVSASQPLPSLSSMLTTFFRHRYLAYPDGPICYFESRVFLLSWPRIPTGIVSCSARTRALGTLELTRSSTAMVLCIWTFSDNVSRTNLTKKSSSLDHSFLFGVRFPLLRPIQLPAKPKPSPTVIFKDGTERIVDNPGEFPDPSEMRNVAQVLEPMIRATIVAPDEYTGAIINLCTVRLLGARFPLSPVHAHQAHVVRPPQSHRGIPLSHSYLSTSSSAATKSRITLLYSLPLSSIITNFHSSLKSLSSGFASFDYEEAPYETSDLVRMNILVNGTKVDALCSVVHRSVVEKEGRDWARRLKEVVPRQQYEVIIQAAVGTNIVARERWVSRSLGFASAGLG